MLADLLGILALEPTDEVLAPEQIYGSDARKVHVREDNPARCRTYVAMGVRWANDHGKSVLVIVENLREEWHLRRYIGELPCTIVPATHLHTLRGTGADMIITNARLDTTAIIPLMQNNRVQFRFIGACVDLTPLLALSRPTSLE